MAQDFHDLTGQVVAKVVSLASELEDSLVKLLVQAAPPEQAQKVESAVLAGPVVSYEGRTDVVANQASTLSAVRLAGRSRIMNRRGASSDQRSSSYVANPLSSPYKRLNTTADTNACVL